MLECALLDAVPPTVALGVVTLETRQVVVVVVALAPPVTLSGAAEAVIAVATEALAAVDGDGMAADDLGWLAAAESTIAGLPAPKTVAAGTTPVGAVDVDAIWGAPKRDNALFLHAVSSHQWCSSWAKRGFC